MAKYAKVVPAHKRDEIEEIQHIYENADGFSFELHPENGNKQGLSRFRFEQDNKSWKEANMDNTDWWNDAQ